MSLAFPLRSEGMGSIHLAMGYDREGPCTTFYSLREADMTLRKSLTPCDYAGDATAPPRDRNVIQSGMKPTVLLFRPEFWS